MDPQAALEELETILDGLASERDAARDQARDLLRWLHRGGFAPSAELLALERRMDYAGFQTLPNEDVNPTLVQLLERITEAPRR